MWPADPLGAPIVTVSCAVAQRAELGGSVVVGSVVEGVVLAVVGVTGGEACGPEGGLMAERWPFQARAKGQPPAPGPRTSAGRDPPRAGASRSRRRARAA